MTHLGEEGERGVSNPIRVATSILDGRMFAGRPTKDGMGFKEPRYDVTSDVLVAIRDKVGIGNEIDVSAGGKVEFRIAVLPPRGNDDGVAQQPTPSTNHQPSAPLRAGKQEEE